MGRERSRKTRDSSKYVYKPEIEKTTYKAAAASCKVKKLSIKNI